MRSKRREKAAERAAMAALQDCARVALAGLAETQANEDPEGPHQLRVGLRRLRSTLSLFREVVDPEAAAGLTEEARWLAREAGRLRDREVVLHEMVAPEAEAGAEGAAELAATLEGGIEAERRALRGLVEEERAAGLLETLRQLADGGRHLPAALARTADKGRRAGPVADKGLRKRWRKARRRAKGLAGMSAEDRHRLRKELKKLRYALQSVDELYPGKRTRRFSDRLKTLQDQFGAMNDAATADRLLTRDLPLPPEAEQAARKIARERHARVQGDWSGARAAWEALRRSRLPWE